MQIKKLALLTAALPAMALAGNYGTYGSGITFGATSPGKGPFTTSNPASLRQATPVGDFGFGILSSLGTAAQVEGAGALAEYAESLPAEIDDFMSQVDALSAPDANVLDEIPNVLAGVGDLEDSIFEVFQVADENLRVRAEATTTIPLFPLRLGTNKFGSFALGVETYAAGEVQLASGPVSLNLDTDTLLSLAGDGGELEMSAFMDLLSTTSSLYVKSAEVADVTLDWAHTVYELGRADLNVGVRVHNQIVNLSKSLTPAKPLAAALLNEDEGAQDEAITELTDNLMDRHIPSNIQYAFSADIGAQIVERYWSLGFTLDHAIATPVSYNELGQCEGLSGQELDECYYAEYFAGTGRIALEETHKKQPVGRIDLGLHAWKNQIALVAAYDLWAENDLFGQQTQEASVAFSFQPNFFLIPDLRLGASKDMLEEGNYGFGLGLSILSLLHVDAGVDVNLADLDTSSTAGQVDIIRGAGVNVGLDLQF